MNYEEAERMVFEAATFVMDNYLDLAHYLPDEFENLEEALMIVATKVNQEGV